MAEFSGLHAEALTPNDGFSNEKVMPTTEQAYKPYNEESEYLPEFYAT